MEMLKSKKGISTGIINSMMIGIIGIVVLFLLLAELVPEAQTAGDTLNSSGVPLGSLFVSTGVVFVIIMASVVLLVVRAFMKKR